MNKHIYKIVIVILIIFFVGGVALGAVNILSNEGTVPAESQITSLSPLPTEKNETLKYFSEVFDLAANSNVKIDKSAYFYISEESVTFPAEGELLKFTALYAKDKITAELNKKLEAKSVDYGKDVFDILTAPEIDAADISEATCYIDAETDESAYVVEIKFPDTAAPVDINSSLAKNISLRSEDEIAKLVGNSFDAYFEISSYSIKYVNCAINAYVDRPTNKIRSLVHVKQAEITAKIIPVGAFAELDEMEISFLIEERTTFSYSWPGISLSAKELSMEKSKTENLLAYINASERLSVTWTSSNEDVATVDKDGYIKSHKNGETTITAKIEYLGQTYTDFCKVNVRVSVDSLKLSKRNLSLLAGEQYQLNAEVGPRKANVKTVTWYSENEEIAVVDKNGNVTAISSGETVVYALSDDGRYRSSCNITVE